MDPKYGALLGGRRDQAGLIPHGGIKGLVQKRSEVLAYGRGIAVMDIEKRQMSDVPPGAADEVALNANLPIPAGHRRNAVRRIFREMVKEELASGPLAPRMRRELVEFASTAGLDAYEARLTIRAVEFELGFATDLTVDPVDDEPISFLTPTTWFLLRFSLACVAGFMLAWLVARMRGII